MQRISIFQNETSRRILNIKEDLLFFRNYPNPFNTATNIEFYLAKTEFVTLKIFDILGKEIVTLVSEKMNAGTYRYSWEAGSLPNGVYIYKIQTGDFQQSRTMILQR